MSYLIDEIIADYKDVIITGHTGPDGDCVGSCMGLYNYMTVNYPDVRTRVFLEDFQEAYHAVKHTDEISTPSEEGESCELMIILDLSNTDRITKGMLPYIDKAGRVVNIDHHVSNTGYGDEQYIRPEASSASEVLCDMLDPDKIPLDAAEALYMGMICDSGVFKYASTSEHTMQMAGMLIRIGVRPDHWIDAVFYERTLKCTRLLGEAIANLQMVCGGRMVWTVLDRKAFDKWDATKQDVEGIVEQLRLIKGVDTALLITETEDGKSKFSFRSKEIVDVNQVASIYGGGGHVRAAGCSVEGSWQDKLPAFIKAAEAMF